jgi:hypothetical protein
MALDYNNDGKVNFSDFTSFLQGETFGIKNWMLALLAGAAWLFTMAPRNIKRKFGIR